MGSGTTHSGCVLNEELYTQINEKFIYLHLFTDYHEDFP